MPHKEAAHSRPPLRNAGWAFGRCVSLVGVVVLIVAYLLRIISLGAGFDVGDGGYWLVSQRDGFARFPRMPGSLTPLTDMLGGAWIFATGSLGLYGARLGWVAINAAAAAMVYVSLTCWFPVARVAIALLAATPLICHQQFPVLEYTNIPWFFLLVFGLLFQCCQQVEVDRRGAIAWSIIAGVALGMAVLSRLPMVAALALPGAMWCVGDRSAYSTRGAVACMVAALLTIGFGLSCMWIDGGLAEMMAGFSAVRAIGQAGQSSLRSYSFFGLLLVYVVHLVTGVEQLSVVATAYGLWITVRTWLSRVAGPRLLGLTWLPLGAAIVGASAAAVTAHGMFNLRFLWGMPFMAAAFCGTVCVLPPAFASQSQQVAVRQLCLLAFLVPALVMFGSNLGFYRMISAGWLAIPLAIVLIPDVAASIAAMVRRVVPDAVRLTGATRLFLYTVVAVLVAYGVTYGCVNEGMASFIGGRSSHPRLRRIWDRSGDMSDLDGALTAVEVEVSPGDTILAYPNLEMFYFITETRSPLRHMFTHEKEQKLLEELEKEPPRCIVFRSNPTNAFWSQSESRRQLMDRFVAAHGYEKIYSNATYSVFRLPPSGTGR